MKKLAMLVLVLVMTTGMAFAEQPVATPAPGTYPLTASGLVDFAYDQLGAGYIMGAYGHISTPDFRRGRANLYPDSAGLIRAFGGQWDGGVIYDCVGLLKGFLIQGGMRKDDVTNVNVTSAFRKWVLEYGPIEGAVLQPGMVLFRMEGRRESKKHMGIYVGDGVLIHARGTRWGVVKDTVPMVFTHWARLNFIEYDMPTETEVYTSRPWLDIGELAVIDTDDMQPAPAINTPYGSGGSSRRLGRFAFGTVVTVVGVVDEMSRMVTGIDDKGREITGYVKLTSLSSVK